MMAKAWMKQDQAPQAEALDTWNTLEAEFNEERKAMLMASAESDKIKEEMNKKFGPGTMKYGSEIPQPEIKTPQAIFEFSQRNPAADGGRMRFDEGLSAKQKKALTITYGKDATKNLEIKRNPGADKVFNKLTNDMYEQFGKEVVDAASIQEYGVPFNEYRPADDKTGTKRQNFVRYFKKDIKDYGEYIGTKNPDKDRRTMKRGIRATREADIKIKLIDATKKGDFFKPEKFAKDNKITLEQLKAEAKQLQRNIYEKRMITAGKKSRSTLVWLSNSDFEIDNVLEKISKSGLVNRKDNRTNNIFYDAFGREFKKGTIDTPNPTYNFEKYKAIRKNVNEFGAIKKLISKKYPNLNFDLDHGLSQQTINKLFNGTAEELSRVNIMDADLNRGFKKSLSEKYFKALGYNANGKQIGKVNLEAKKAVEKIAKDLNINIGNVSDDLKTFDRGVQSFEKLNIREELIKSLKNQKDLNLNFKTFVNENPKLLTTAGFDITKINEPKTQVSTQQIDEIEKYITDRTGKVKQPILSSGLSGAYEMLSDDLKAIVDSEGFKKFSASKTAKGLSTVARAPGKLFGLGDVLIGYLDYTNNKPMMSKAKAYQSMLQAMSFNIYKGGDEQNLLEIKEKFLANGGDGKIFDQVIELNKSNYDMKKYIENAQERYQTLSTTGLETDKKRAKEEMQSAVNNIKMMGEKGLDKFSQYKTDLAVSESGGPIQIKGVTQPIKDTKKAAFDLFEEEQIKNYPSTYDQVNTGSGLVAEQIYNSILTKDSYKKLLPQNIPSTINQLLGLNFKPVTENEKEAALIKEMKKNAPQELYRYNKEFRDMDPDKPMTIEETANFMNKNKKAIGFAEGGITGLRSKYEYKK